eukprot:CAMPEP_0205920092 /NCGR_PEP_ID=MMETSP1325-20131115/10860_1 /ASSEMBLY_ACC=CAM_ASM_000708 /TAXON_ID=236786 /ORGANISM="Florenciella sp., Strain RCC1007" /LENGTH=91 /DNA_ID=CAMNT_0053287751 /DNA_START=62 /DNA_END=334 /DNA_ORIENTATION=-
MTAIRLLAAMVGMGAVCFSVHGASMPWEEDLIELKKKEMEPITKELMQEHGLHPGMVLDQEAAWLIKYAMGGEKYNRLFDFDVWRQQNEWK